MSKRKGDKPKHADRTGQQGGYCFAHGSYTTGTLCPQFPSCLDALCRACERPVLVHRCREVVLGDLVKQREFKAKWGAWHPFGEFKDEQKVT